MIWWGTEMPMIHRCEGAYDPPLYDPNRIMASASTHGWGLIGDPATTIIIKALWKCPHCGKLRLAELLECPGCGYVRE